MSGVTCPVSHIIYKYFFFYKLVGLVGGGSVIDEAYHVKFNSILIFSSLTKPTLRYSTQCSNMWSGLVRYMSLPTLYLTIIDRPPL